MSILSISNIIENSLIDTGSNITAPIDVEAKDYDDQTDLIIKIVVSMIVIIFISKIILDLVSDSSNGGLARVGHDKYIRITGDKI